MTDPLSQRSHGVLARWRENLWLAAGAVAALLALVVMVGWLTHSKILTGVTTSYRPMVSMTALCFLLCGSALVALRFQRRWIACLTAAVAGLLGAERLGEYVLRVDSGLDRALSPPFARSDLLLTQMARLTAFGFVLAGLAVLLAAGARPFRLRSRLVGLAGSIVFSVGAIFVLLYLAGTSAHIWGPLTGMAPDTAGGMVLLGTAILLVGWRDDLASGHASPTWLPVLVLVGGLVSTLWLWQAQVAEQRGFVERAVRLQTDGLRNDLAEKLRSQRLALERMARRWEIRGTVPLPEWESDAALYVAHNPGLQAVEWVDPSLTVRQVAPAQRNEPAVNQNLGAEERARPALEAARQRGAVTLTRPLSLGNGKIGFLACAPISSGQTFGGFIVGVFRLDTLLDSVWRDQLAAGCSVSVSNDGRDLYRRRSASLPANAPAQEAILDPEGLSLRVKVWPSRELLASSSSLPFVVLLAGLVASSLMALSVVLAQAARRRASEAEEARRALEAEAQERRKRETEIAERTRLAVFAADVGAALTREASLRDALSRCAEAMIRHLGGSAASVWRLDEEENVLELQGSAWAGEPLFGPDARVPVGEFRIGAIARDRRPALVDLTAGTEREDDGDWARRKGVVAFAGYPLLVEDRVVGVMALFADRPLTEAALHAMASVADEIALGIDRARAMERAGQQLAFTTTITRNIGEGVCALDREGRVTFANPAAERMLQWSETELLGKNLHETIHFQRADGTRVPADESPLLGVLRSAVSYRAEEDFFTRRDGSLFPVSYSSTPILEKDKPVGAVLAFRDITEQRRRERRLATEYAARQVLATSVSLGEATPRLLEVLCENLGWDVGALWRVDAAAGLLRCVEFWRVQGFEGTEFEVLSRRITFSKGIGLPGRVWATEVPSWIENVVVDPNFPRAAAAIKNGLHGAFGFPILSGGKVAGVIELFSRKAHEPDWDLLMMAGNLGSQIGQFMERKAAEQALRKSEERYRSLFESMLHGYAHCEMLFENGQPRDFIYLHVNRAFEKLTGLKDVVGKRASQVIPGIQESAQELLQIYGRVASTGVPERFETYLDALGIWFSISAYSPRKGYFVALFDDITERKRSEEALRGSEARTRSILDHMLGGLITVDRKGVIESVNPAAERIFGYGKDELVGRNLTILVPDSVAPDRRTLLEAAFPRALGRITEWEGQRKNGEVFPFELSMFEFETAEGSLFAGNIRDISEHREVDRLKKEFVSTVSHELRTPLTAIRGSLGLLAGGVVGALPKEAGKLVGIALKNSERLVLLVNDILEMEKIESGRTEFRPELAEIAPLVESALESNRAYADQYGVSFLLEDFAPGARVRIDRDRFAQVLANLLSNAAKFSPGGETVAVAVTRRGSKLRVSVTDRGPGIPKEFYSRIFQRFQQADSSDARQKAGSGLGLSIAKSIVTRLGGEIGFQTEVGAGTTFFVDLPEWGAGPEAAAGEALLAGARVLVCEDDPEDARWLSQILQDGGLMTEIAPSAQEARRLLERNHYDVMTLDLLLPDEDGLSLLSDLRAREETRGLPVVVVSVSAGRRREEWTGNAVALVEWIQKPVDWASLAEAIRRVTGAAGAGRRRILHVEDDPDVLAIASALLREEAEVVPATTLKEARERLAREAFDLVLLDIELPDGSGLELLPLLSIPVVVFSAHEITRQQAESMAAVLLKSRATNEKLLDTIRGLLHPTRDAAPPAVARAAE